MNYKTVFLKHAVKVKGDMYDFYEIPVKDIEPFLKELNKIIHIERAKAINRIVRKYLPDKKYKFLLVKSDNR